MTILQEDNLIFDFRDASVAFKFDEPGRTSPPAHGLSHCMKAVDIIAEYPDHDVFVEVKDLRGKERVPSEQELLTALRLKFRDTFLYRWAEEKVGNPVLFLCLVELDNAAVGRLTDELKRTLPVDVRTSRWKRPLAKTCAVLNCELWNQNFPNMPVRRA